MWYIVDPYYTETIGNSASQEKEKNLFTDMKSIINLHSPISAYTIHFQGKKDAQSFWSTDRSSLQAVLGHFGAFWGQTLGSLCKSAVSNNMNESNTIFFSLKYTLFGPYT